MNYVTLKELAEQLGIDKSNARKYVLNLGIEFQKIRTKDSKNQLVLCLSEPDAHIVLSTRKDSGFQTLDGANDSSLIGVFYIVQLVPELDKRRVKLGYTTSIVDRLQQHRTAAPTAKLLKTWPCKKTWELTIIDYLASINCKLIRNEVFETSNIEELIERGNKLFSLLPDPKKDKELSNYSK